MKKSFVVLVAVLFVAMAAVVFAAPQGPGPGMGKQGGPCMFMGPGDDGPGGFPAGLSARLGLTKEQTDKMQAITDRFKAETKDLRYDLAQRHLEMRKLFSDPKTDGAVILAKQKEMHGQVIKLMELKGQMMVERRKVLTAEQIQKLDGAFGGRHGRGGRGGCGGCGFGMGAF